MSETRLDRASMDDFRAMAADLTALRQRIEALAELWQKNAASNEGAGQFPWAMWQNRANDLRAALGDTA